MRLNISLQCLLMSFCEPISGVAMSEVRVAIFSCSKTRGCPVAAYSLHPTYACRLQWALKRPIVNTTKLRVLDVGQNLPQVLRRQKGYASLCTYGSWCLDQDQKAFGALTCPQSGKGGFHLFALPQVAAEDPFKLGACLVSTHLT